MSASTKNYEELHAEFKPYIKMMGQAADSIINQEISSYPIFIMHQTQVPFGLPLVEREKLGGRWSVHASTLEEFVTKQLVEQEKIGDFKGIYKDPKNYLCLFVIQAEGASFIFLPRL